MTGIPPDICRVAALALPFVLSAAPLLAQEDAGAACDRLTSAPLDNRRAAPPVDDADVRLDEAEAACRAAVKAAPDTPRFKYQLSRVLFLKERTAEAVVTMVQASHAGYPAAVYAMAILYLEGGPVEANPVKAVELITAAAEHGLPPAQRDLGMMLYSGSGVEQDATAAFDWFMKAAAEAEPHAAYMAATMMCKGEAPDHACADGHDMLLHAASEGVAQADFVLGQIYGGLTPDIPRDTERYLHHMNKAGEAGFFPADIALGREYMAGGLLEEDAEQAARHFCRAGRNGVAFAKDSYGLELDCAGDD